MWVLQWENNVYIMKIKQLQKLHIPQKCWDPDEGKFVWNSLSWLFITNISQLILCHMVFPNIICKPNIWSVFFASIKRYPRESEPGDNNGIVLCLAIQNFLFKFKEIEPGRFHKGFNRIGTTVGELVTKVYTWTRWRIIGKTKICFLLSTKQFFFNLVNFAPIRR